jgi:hypothetical protein
VRFALLAVSNISHAAVSSLLRNEARLSFLVIGQPQARLCQRKWTLTLEVCRSITPCYVFSALRSDLQARLRELTAPRDPE